MRKGRFGFGPDALAAGQTPGDAAETPTTQGDRLGPMATAVRDAGRANAESGGHLGVDELATLELAVAMKSLRDAQLDLRVLPLELIDEDNLRRDRTAVDPDALEELKTSIRDQGLSLPIRVDLLDSGRYGLNQGRRRLMAFRALLEETGDPRYAAIPALVDRAGARESAYRRMVDENLIREDVSLAELAGLAISYAGEASLPPDAAVERLFASASRNRRWTIGAFVRILAAIGGALRHPAAIGRDLGRALARRVEDGGADAIVAALAARPDRSAAEEIAILESACSAPKTRPRRAAGAGPRTFRIVAKRGEARRYDVSVTDRKIVISGRDVGGFSDDRLRAWIQTLVDG